MNRFETLAGINSGWSEARTKAAIERGNAMIAAAMLKGAEG